ncbi:ATPase [Ilyomonas limi]|uniref:ATPase n=1 Tax=Ilyomonas limi TaxID=2575867 RepID=A0A4U3L1U7_9BACT|nr:ATPase [Ilyomonas limi]TKK68975.1 ATPase [Ilyomonas limi]
MKRLVLFTLLTVFGLSAFANENTDSVKVNGNCGSCKKRIEKAAMDAGAISANWSDETQILAVKYDDAKTSLLAIEKKIASVGHDTRDVKAPDAAYKNLEECCQYDRTKMTPVQ